MKISLELSKSQQRAEQVIQAGGTVKDVNILDRAKQAIRYVIQGAPPDTWFGPLQPLQPSTPEPEEVKGRRLDYEFGRNIWITPRQEEPITFSQLRALADNCDILRLVIETVKDEIARMEWSITAVDEEDNRSGKYETEIKKLKDFLRFPDNENNWDQWTRMIFEEMLVTDATAVYMRRTKGKDVYSLEQIDGATIAIKIDADGRTPQPPDTAYQQVLKGIPAVDFTRDELIYFPRNKRIWKFYGFSPVEQLVFYVNMALRRDIFKLNYYTEGNIPDLLLGVPESWTPDQIKHYQDWWDSMLSGNLAQRRHGKFVPGEVAKNVKELKEAILKDEFDEWLARLICFCFSISPQPFVREMNRATAQTNAEMAKSEGLMPKLIWFKALMDYIIVKYFNYPGLQFTWDMETDVDPAIQSQIDSAYITNGVQTPQQIAAARGLEWDEEAAAKKEEEKQMLAAQLNQNQGDQKDEKGKTNEKGKENPFQNDKDENKEGDEDDKAEKLEKTKKKRVSSIKPIDRERKAVLKARAELKSWLKEVFDETKKKIKVMDFGLGKLSIDDKKRVDQILEELDLSGFAIIQDASEEILKAITKDGLYQALLQIGLKEEDMTKTMFEQAQEYAVNRAAEMVGKKWVNGKLIDNPTAKWHIEQSTREALRTNITSAIEEGWSHQKLVDKLMNNYGFSEQRAEMIARTEVSFADQRSNMIAYKESGVVAGKYWLLSTLHPDNDECDENAAQDVIPIDEAFQSGDMEPPLHPNCFCDCIPVLDEEMEAE